MKLHGEEMIDLIEQNRAAIENICRRFHIKRLDAFGSAVEGTWDPVSSDLDFAVEFESLEPGQLVENARLFLKGIGPAKSNTLHLIEILRNS